MYGDFDNENINCYVLDCLFKKRQKKLQPSSFYDLKIN